MATWYLGYRLYRISLGKIPNIPNKQKIITTKIHRGDANP